MAKNAKAVIYHPIRCPNCFLKNVRSFCSLKLRRYYKCFDCKMNFISIEQEFNRKEFMSECRKAQRIHNEQNQISRGSAYDKIRGSNNPKWKGGRIKDHRGYVWIKMRRHPQVNKFGYILEHRIVMESKKGRPLKSSEVVHHINGKRDDNRPENLMLFKDSAAHMKHHAKTRAKKKIQNL